MYDYHIHPNYSLDASGQLHEFCDAAIAAGLTEIAFTTHLDSDPATDDGIVLVEGEKIDVRSNLWLEHYEAAIRKVGEDYKEKGLIVLLGVELDLYPGVTENIPDRFFDTDFDIILGSAHLIDHKAISAQKEAHAIFKKYSMEEIGEKYFNILIDGINEGLVNILAHIDLYRRYGEQFYGNKISNLWKPHIEELTASMLKNDVGFEINTSTWRKGLEEPMPSEELIVALFKRGVTVVTLGSDAHKPEIVGSGIRRASLLMRDLGITHPAKLRNGKCINQ